MGQILLGESAPSTAVPFPEAKRYVLAGHRPINRYSIGDPTNGLKYDENGALTVYIQNAPPGKDKESTWLPAPDGPFGEGMRIHEPKPEVLKDTWAPPPVKRVGISLVSIQSTHPKERG